MQLGGWWRLWIGLSAIWAVIALAVAFGIAGRPTPEKVAQDVGSACDLDTPVPVELASRTLALPGQLAQINALDGDANDAVRKPIVKAAISTVEELEARAGRSGTYEINIARDPEGERHILVLPADFKPWQVYAQVDKDKYATNSWAKFGSYCTEQLQAQAKNALYPIRLKEWVLSTLAGLLSFPLLSLLLGAFTGWVWRGFRQKKPPRSENS